jgi:Co/Zn/Cd efflux system component
LEKGYEINPRPNKAIEKRFVRSMLFAATILIAEGIGGMWTGSLALLIHRARGITLADT